MAKTYAEALRAGWVRNQGSACTSAALLTGLAGLGAVDLPPLAEASLRLGASRPCGPPALLDYFALWGPSPLDRRVEALAREHGVTVRSRTRLCGPATPIRTHDNCVTVLHVAWGQERPGHYGSWGWNPLRPSTYDIGGHSVVLLEIAGPRWTVLDPNHPLPQTWPRPGLVVSLTRLSLTS